MADDNSDLKSMSTDDLHKLVHDLRHEQHPHKDAARRKAAIAELHSRGEKTADTPAAPAPTPPTDPTPPDTQS